MENAIAMPQGAVSSAEETAVSKAAETAIAEVEHIRKQHMDATIDMIDFVREHRGHINSFNALVDEAVGRPKWLTALMEPGICTLIRTYCHD